MADIIADPAVDLTHTCHIHGTMVESEFYRCSQKNRSGKEVIVWRCKTCSKSKRKARYHQNPETSKAATTEWKRENRERARATTNKSYHKNKDKYLPRYKSKREELKVRVLSHYSDGSPRCALCSESHVKFLALDHVNGDGGAHRKELGPRHCGSKFYIWVVENDFPARFRVLCHNCNFKECLRHNRESFALKEWEKTHKTRVIDGKEYPVDLKKQAIAKAKYRSAIKLECLVRYSSVVPSCACCGTEDQDVLSIDHIDGEGRKHRANVTGNGSDIYMWLRDNGFPTGYRVFCLNCNFTHGAYKVCPHKEG